jgi:hypothetical protein
MAYLYRHIRLDTNVPFYIGIGADSKGKYKRAFENRHRNPHWHNIAKFGYEVEILLDDLTWEEACAKEIEFIKLYGRNDINQGPLCNMTDGGEGMTGRIFSKETRDKISKNTIGKPKSGDPWNKGKSLSKEHIQKLKDNHWDVSGSNNPMYGKPGTRLGIKCTEETRNKMSESKKGENHPMYGKPALSRKKVKHLETGLVFDCQKDAALYFKRSVSTISTQVKQGKFIIIID